MSNESKAFGAVTGKIRRLLVTLSENAAVLPDISVERANLERELTAAEEAKNRQDAFIGEKQLATQEIRVAIGRANEAVLQLQSAARFKLGPRNEKLASFLVKPLRRHTSRLASKLAKQEEALAKQEESLLEKEAELAQRRQDTDHLKREVELLKREMAVAELTK